MANVVEQLRQRAHRQTIALADTLSELERLGAAIRQHLPWQRSKHDHVYTRV